MAALFGDISGSICLVDQGGVTGVLGEFGVVAVDESRAAAVPGLGFTGGACCHRLDAEFASVSVAAWDWFGLHTQRVPMMLLDVGREEVAVSTYTVAFLPVSLVFVARKQVSPMKLS